MKCGNADLVNAPASTLQDNNLQQLGSVTLCIFTGIYSEHLQKINSCPIFTQQQKQHPSLATTS